MVVVLTIFMCAAVLRVSAGAATFRLINGSMALIAALMLSVALLSEREVPGITVVFPLLPFFCAAIGSKRSAIAWVIIVGLILAFLYFQGKDAAFR